MGEPAGGGGVGGNGYGVGGDIVKNVEEFDGGGGEFVRGDEEVGGGGEKAGEP